MFHRLRQDINSIIERDPAARNAWEVLTCYPGLQAIVMHRWAHWCWTRRMKWLGRFVSYLARIVTGIEIHPGATIGRRVFIDHGFGVVIGETAEVGDDCTIYQGVTLGGTSLHTGAKRHPTLGRGVIIGAGAKVLGGFTVGEYAKVGSNAVLLKPVPPGATAVGNPAHIVQKELLNAAANPFAAYGVTPNGDDPLSKALRGLIENAVKQEQRIEQLVATMKAAGLECQSVAECDKLNSDQLNKLVE
ncbi:MULTISPECIES: serine O-acetyltransferase [unclassified Duganella]|jgi:serine O-acetyltransferase|uniref:serine O-acetyltransferase n=1 Tax=unclassified Duganella TaxID=2636909 RepID=UPI0008901E0D|nr:MULTISPECIES: serine O-acetyltransferase [unclassified Duganella]SDG40419.1 serine O-acetyltransferase [Duganella sp. OV458]SDJ63503.1 serine O-acetyltransferase [Duganella sp. OV510]